MPKEKPMPQAVTAYKDARARMGDGWHLLSEEMQEALVCREVVFIMLAQCESMTSKEPLLTRLLTMARQALNLAHPEGD